MDDQHDAGLPAAVDTSVPAPAPEPQAKGLDAIISQAIEEHHEADETPSSDRARDERGRFAPKNPPAPEAAAAQPAQPADGAENAADQSTDQTTQATPPAVEAPRNFTADQKAEFAKLPPEAQKVVSEIERAREAEYTRRNQEVAELRRVAEPLYRAVQPYQQYLGQLSQSYGVHPAELISQLFRAEVTLRTGSPDAKAEALAGIVADYGIDLSLLTGNAAHAPSQEVTQLRQQVQSLSQQLHQIQSYTESAQAEQAASAIDQFRNAKDASGAPLYPFFDAVKVAMAHYIQAGQANSIEEAYRLAAKPIEERLAGDLQARAQQADAQRKAAVEKARKVQHVRPAGSMPGGQTTGKKGLDSIIGDAVAKHWS